MTEYQETMAGLTSGLRRIKESSYDYAAEKRDEAALMFELSKALLKWRAALRPFVAVGLYVIFLVSLWKFNPDLLRAILHEERGGKDGPVKTIPYRTGRRLNKTTMAEVGTSCEGSTRIHHNHVASTIAPKLRRKPTSRRLVDAA